MPHTSYRLADRLAADVFPDFGAVNGATEIEEIIGALLTIVLIVAVLMILGATAFNVNKWNERSNEEGDFGGLI